MTHRTHLHSSSSGTLLQYALMIHAGSTGSRIRIYKFNNCGASPEYEYEVFEMAQPGLSSFTGNPEGAARSLDILWDGAIRAAVPKALHGCTPVAVKATAGLRLLPGSQSADILNAVEGRIHSYPFQLQEKDGVVIMDGKDEGVYAWITANYLLGTIKASTPPDTPPTYAVLDLVGASRQIVFKPVFASSDMQLEEGEHRYDLQFGGGSHVLYEHSYLGYGLMRHHAQHSVNGLTPVAKDVAATAFDVDRWQGTDQLIRVCQPLMDIIGHVEARDATFANCMLQLIWAH